MRVAGRVLLRLEQRVEVPERRLHVPAAQYNKQQQQQLSFLAISQGGGGLGGHVGRGWQQQVRLRQGCTGGRLRGPLSDM